MTALAAHRPGQRVWSVVDDREVQVSPPPQAPEPATDPASWDADRAVEELYAAHWAPMVRLAALLLHDRAAAEDVVQDALVAVHRRWNRLQDPGAGVGYLRTCVVNGARSALRRRGVEQRLRPLPDPSPPAPDDVAADLADEARVMSLVRALPQRQREVLVLRYYADLSEDEIARTLEIGRGSVKSHAHRGMTALRSALTDAGDLP